LAITVRGLDVARIADQNNNLVAGMEKKVGNLTSSPPTSFRSVEGFTSHAGQGDFGIRFTSALACFLRFLRSRLEGLDWLTGVTSFNAQKGTELGRASWEQEELRFCLVRYPWLRGVRRLLANLHSPRGWSAVIRN
jgi:hypothetical protein